MYKRQVPNITIENGREQVKFSFQMTPEEKAEARKFYEEEFKRITQKAEKEQYDVLFMDETIYTCLLYTSPVKIDKTKNMPASTAKANSVFARLVAAGQRLLTVIRHNEHGANKDLAKFTSQIESLCDKWDR